MKLHQTVFRAMGGENEIQIYSEQPQDAELAANAVIEEVRRIERKFSRYLPDSIVSQINSGAGKTRIAVDQETAALIDYADACFRQSGGLFDITSGVFRRVWNFRERKLPLAAEIKDLLPLVGWKKAYWKKPFFYLPTKGMEIDFGGIGKEYAVDRAAGILIEQGFGHSLVNLAGDIRVCGPQPGNLPWNVGIADPRIAGGMLGSVEVRAGAVATSGDYERMIEIDGRRYSHLLNPKTGWPAAGLQSVSVLADSCLIAGSLTTTAMLNGESGEKYLREVGVPYVMITTDGAVRYSNSLSPYLRQAQNQEIALELSNQPV